jgi:hypothetical protein
MERRLRSRAGHAGIFVLLAATFGACDPGGSGVGPAVGQLDRALSGQVTGWVDGVFGPAGAQYIQGWACEPNNPSPLTIHLYTDGPAGSGQIFGGFLANSSPNDAGVSAACGTTTGHRFLIDVTGDLFDRVGQIIYVHGIAQSGGPNNLLQGSGSHRIPSATTTGVLDAITADGFAWGWAFDNSSTANSIGVRIYADGSGGQGAETGTLVWSGTADQFRPDVNNAYHIDGNHGFSVQLPSWVATDMHRLSAYAVSINGAVAPIGGSPKVPGGSAITSSFSMTTSQPGFPSQWYGYTLPPGPVTFAGLAGTVSLSQFTDLYSEYLFLVGYLPSGECPTGGTPLQWGPPGAVFLWSDIVKAPTRGTFTTPVSFTLPAGVPVASCLLVGINGGPVSISHPATGTVNLTMTYTHSASPAAQVVGIGGEFCFGQNWGCQGATNDNTKSFANMTMISQRSRLKTIWGNVSDTTFDGTGSFGPPPTGPWTAFNDVYIYRGADCNQFTGNVNGPSDYYSRIPGRATHLLSLPLSGGAGVSVAQTINFLQPGLTNGVAVYQTFSDVTLEPGDCLVTLYGMQGDGAFDNESQLSAIVQRY